MNEQPVPKFKIGELRQTRRPAVMCDGVTPVATAAVFRIGAIEPVIRGDVQTFHYHLWHISWQDIKNEPPDNKILIFSQREVVDHTRPCLLPLRLLQDGTAVFGKKSADNVGYYGRLASKGDKL